MTPKFSVLIQWHSFYYSSWFLWVRNLGRAELADSGCGTLIAVRWWLELEQWPGWGWSSGQLGDLFIWSKGVFMWPLLMGSLGFLTTWQPQGNQAAHKAWSFLERSKPNESYIAFYDLAQKSHSLIFASFYFIFARETQAFPESRGRELYSISWWGSDKILE